MNRSELLHMMSLGRGCVRDGANRDWRAFNLMNRVEREACGRLANVGWTDAARAASLAVRRAKALGAAAVAGIRPNGQYSTVGGQTVSIPATPPADGSAGKTIGALTSGSPMHLHREGEFGIAGNALFECINGQTVRVGKAKYFSINDDGSLSVKPHVYEAGGSLEDMIYSPSHRTTMINGVPYDLETGYAVVTGVEDGNYPGLTTIPSSILGVYSEVSPGLKLARRSSSPDFFDEKGTRYTYSGGVYTNTATGRAYRATGAVDHSVGGPFDGAGGTTVPPLSGTGTTVGNLSTDETETEFIEYAPGLSLKQKRYSQDFLDAKGDRYIYSFGKFINTHTGKVTRVTPLKPELLQAQY